MATEIQIHEAEWTEHCDPGVYLTLVELQDGTRDFKRIGFSRRLFGEHQAETWWSDNREKIYKKYNVLPKVWNKSSVFGLQAAQRSEEALPFEALSSDFSSLTTKIQTEVQWTYWTEQYEPGVYITLSALPAGTREIKRVRFSRRRFGEIQAKKWWSDYRDKVYEKYNVPKCWVDQSENVIID